MRTITHAGAADIDAGVSTSALPLLPCINASLSTHTILDIHLNEHEELCIGWLCGVWTHVVFVVWHSGAECSELGVAREEVPH